jgi:hypothetical protein
MRKWIVAVLAVLAMSLGLTRAARAAGDPDFGKSGQFILSADRLVPFFAFTSEGTTFEPNPNTRRSVSSQNSSISLLWGRTANATIVYTIPRVGFDFTVVDQLTLGGSIVAVFGLGGSTTTTNEVPGQVTETTRDSARLSGFGFTPRVGYIIPLSDVFHLWLRGGFGIYTFSVKTPSNNPNTPNDSDSLNHFLFSLGLDPQLVIVPIPHFGITAGIPLDVSLTGNQSFVEVRGATTRTTDLSYRQFAIGINLGLLGYF